MLHAPVAGSACLLFLVEEMHVVAPDTGKPQPVMKISLVETNGFSVAAGTVRFRHLVSVGQVGYGPMAVEAAHSLVGRPFILVVAAEAFLGFNRGSRGHRQEEADESR